MTSSQLRCVLWVICCLLSVVNTLLERRGIGKVQRRDNHGLYQRTTLGNLSNAFHFATDKFVSGIEVAVQQLNAYHRPLLVHTKDGVRCYSMMGRYCRRMGGAACIKLSVAPGVTSLLLSLYSDQMYFYTLERMLRALQYLFQCQVIVIYR